MTAGYSGTPLIKKLGLKEGTNVQIINEPDHYWDMLGIPQESAASASKGEPLDFVHLFVKSKEQCEELVTEFRSKLRPSGIIWVSWPKKSSKIVTDITEDAIRAIALERELVDVKVCAVDEIWSGLKLVIPVKLRGGKG